ncbi:MAG: quinone-interacting membrane-bound oxidoreductase complex subunit QmoC [Desulfobulbaceae bacterium]|nr:quinone-interacting membrane-bound oxidoreductase complex subunit QmoC [Desulfobulbaceae bacterium]HIJ79988.1 quinone-interacting membrane-bound oxidoreductase complex subunit QmoC [Deltaproteobacteria bacterium]
MAIRVEPDLNFIKFLKSAGGDTLKKCYQCATCSVVCPLSSDNKPFPRKEMIWAQWGLKDRLVADPDVMLCHQCGDCTAYCPRGAKPGDVLGAIRAYAYTHYGFPNGLAKLVSQGKNLPILIGAPALLILIVWFLSGGMHLPQGDIDFGNFFGHGYFMGLTKNVLIIDAIFVPAFAFAVFAAYKGVSNMWNNMAAQLDVKSDFRPSVPQFITQFLVPSVKEILAHKRFKECGTNHDRVNGHLPLLLAFIGLFAVTTYGMIRKDIVGMFVEGLHGPIPLSDPFKILANVSAIALIVGVGILWMNRSRMEEENNASPTFYDWFLITKIMAVGVTGLCAELTRLIGIPVLAYLFYYLHLVTILMLFVYMPYSKFAHMVYRTFAMAFEKYRASEFVQKTEE